MPLSRSNNRDTHGGGSWREPFSVLRSPIWEVEKAVLRLKKPGGRERFILKNFHIKPSVPGESFNELSPAAKARGEKYGHPRALRMPECTGVPRKGPELGKLQVECGAAMIEEKAEAVV